MALIDLTRAFDTVDRQALWSMLSRHCYHEKYTRILRLVHAGMSVPQRSATAALTLAFHSENGGQTGMHYPGRAQSSKPRANLAPPSLWRFICKQRHHCTPPRIPPELLEEGNMFRIITTVMLPQLQRTGHFYCPTRLLKRIPCSQLRRFMCSMPCTCTLGHCTVLT